jgi:hypothetical protein
MIWVFSVLILLCSLSLYGMEEDTTKRQVRTVRYPMEEKELTPEEWEKFFGEGAPKRGPMLGIRVDMKNLLIFSRAVPAHVSGGNVRKIDLETDEDRKVLTERQDEERAALAGLADAAESRALKEEEETDK